MKILTITYADGSPYWTEHFNTEEELNSWLSVEKTRPYWKEEFVCNIETIEEPQINMSEVMAEAEAKRASAKAKLLALGLTEEEIGAILGM